jgi:DNA-binding transcriptional LysR family regulator
VALLAQSFFEELQQVRAADGAFVVSVAAAESVLRWVLFPKLADLTRVSPQVRFEFHNLRTDVVVGRVHDGTVHFGIVRDDAHLDGLDSHSVGEMRYALVVPRTILPQGRTEDIFLLKALPVGLLASDGRLKQGIEDLARSQGFSLNVKLVADSFALLLDAAPRARCAVVLPSALASELPAAQFAVVNPPEFSKLNRRLSLIANPGVMALRSGLRRVAENIKRVV